MSHADASPSSASIWLRCPASVTQARGRQRKATIYTREGTAAHEVAERLAYGLNIPPEIEVDGESVEVTEEMIEHVQVYVDYIRALRRKAEIFSTETRVELDWLPEPIFGTADVFAFYDGAPGHGSILEIVDLKFGKGVVVGAGGPQLRIYALGALRGDDHWIDKIRMTIVQPRITGSPVVATEEMEWKELQNWGRYELEPAVQRIADNDPTENPGPHCRWCVRAGECRTLHDQSLIEARDAFASIPAEEAAALSNEELSRALDAAELIVSWIAHIRAEASQRADKGQTIPNWKLVPKRAQRKWIDELEAMDRLLDELGLTTDEVTKLVSPAAVEKVLKAQRIDASRIADLVIKESSGSTLVREKDEREGLVLDAKSVFSSIA